MALSSYNSYVVSHDDVGDRLLIRELLVTDMRRLLVVAVFLVVVGGCSQESAEIRTARGYVSEWAEMGMWLPDTQVPFFENNFLAVQSVLGEALSDPVEDVRQRAAFIVEELGPVASTLEPILVQRVEHESSRLVRMYLYRALRGIKAESPQALSVLRSRFHSLVEETVSPLGDAYYTFVDERISVAAALYVLAQESPQRDVFREFVLQWLLPPSPDLSTKDFADYLRHRWCAVISVEFMHGADEAIPLLESMLNEEDAKPWVTVHVPRALRSLQGGSEP